ncbi:pyruvate dehydrogenase complex dihydrolipoamide acetyltransferase [Formicincola oecophyllae]|uniref:Acetyltransferase component of pyruvate dehydrogenase complex n=1 Tax=Formicincola oecophyllae TaxID=2558361 RepID=A0A4Y6U952_9PROT|nr:pyruvate dehydrogenase complex dihydrolipoamide acetyltransferase [Formicincola oecophyllae]QDH13993.1 pyruvate dehydrogenase complex dihydrolipoamide acetyltransferase [Formicincola oecophyllae]
MSIQILMPALSPTMTAGTLSKWLKKEGDNVQPGDIIAEIETDKAVMDVEAIDEGVLEKILVAEGTADVPVNTPIALVSGEEATVPQGAATPQSPQQAAQPASPSAPNAVPSAKPAGATGAMADLGRRLVEGTRIFISPLARRLAREEGIALDSLTGTGPKGRILRRDVEERLRAPQPKPAPAQAPQKKPSSAQPAPGRSESAAPVERIPHSGMRRTIARRLTQSKGEVPHFYVSVDVELDALLKLRGELNAALMEEGAKISVNDMLIKASALALKKVPALNVQFTETEMLAFSDIDISMAVSVPDGLITPVIRNADTLSLRDIATTARDLAKRAREGKLRPAEYEGGSFSISNMGMMGVKSFSAIINPPQAAILAVAAGEKRPVVRDGALAIATVMTATLSVDHRATDGAAAAQWLKAFKELVQKPHRLVV